MYNKTHILENINGPFIMCDLQTKKYLYRRYGRYQ